MSHLLLNFTFTTLHACTLPRCTFNTCPIMLNPFWPVSTYSCSLCCLDDIHAIGSQMWCIFCSSCFESSFFYCWTLMCTSCFQGIMYSACEIWRHNMPTLDVPNHPLSSCVPDTQWCILMYMHVPSYLARCNVWVGLSVSHASATMLCKFYLKWTWFAMP